MQSTKQAMDWHIQEVLTCEVLRLDPNNKMLNKFFEMQNHHGATMRNFKKQYDKHGTWNEPQPGSLL